MVPTQGYRCTLAICVYGILLLFTTPVSSEQICESFPGPCAPDTCCNPDTCAAEGSKIKCCEDVSGIGCSNCPKCVNCEWTEWSECGKLEEQCGDGSKPQRVRGEMTRKYKQQAGPGGIECVAADIEGQKRLTKAPCYKECPGCVEFEKAKYEVQESSTEIEVQCIRKNGLEGEFSVAWKSINGTAKKGINFIANEQNILFPDGTDRQKISLRINPNAVHDGDKSFQINLTNANNGAYICTQNVATITILEDDGMWSDWKTWSECSETCGGMQQRTRNCEYPNPTQPGSPCPGISSEQQSCEECQVPCPDPWDDTYTFIIIVLVVETIIIIVGVGVGKKWLTQIKDLKTRLSNLREQNDRRKKKNCKLRKQYKELLDKYNKLKKRLEEELHNDSLSDESEDELEDSNDDKDCCC